jgi:hypothetical protein
MIMRHTNVSVVDMCGDLDPGSLNGPSFIWNNVGGKQMKKGSTEDTKSNQAVTDGQTDPNTQGMQAALIIVPSEGWTDSTTGASLYSDGNICWELSSMMHWWRLSVCLVMW